MDENVPLKLVEYRVREVESDVRAMRDELRALRDRLVTREQFAELKSSIDRGRSFNANFWVNIVLGSTLSGLIVGVILLIASHNAAAAAGHP